MKEHWLVSVSRPVVVAVGSIMLAAALLSSCKSPPQTAYTVAQTSTITVEAAMGLWNQYVGEKHPGAPAELRVKTAFDQYRAADIALLTAGKAMLEAQKSSDAAKQTSATKAWREAEAALTASAGQVYSLLRELGVQLP